MLSTAIPARLIEPFCATGTKNTIPKVQVNPGQASFDAGFPPETMEPLLGGGVPPDGHDMNGILYDATAGAVWAAAGGFYPYDATFSTAIGGYPKGAVLAAADLSGLWISTADNNTTNPDTGGANWSVLVGTGVTSQAVTTANVALTAPQTMRPQIVASGALTGNRVLSLAGTDARTWVVTNNCTGAFALRVKYAGSGTGVIVPQGQTAEIVGNGTDLVNLTPNPQMSDRLWLVWDNTASILDEADPSGLVSSLTTTGSGQYTLTLTAAISPDALLLVSCQKNPSNNFAGIRIDSFDGTTAVFRNYDITNGGTGGTCPVNYLSVKY